MKDDIFTIGDFCFRMIYPGEIPIPENFRRFQGGTDSAYTYTLALSRDFPEPRGRVLTQRHDLLVTEEAGLERRWLGDYACIQEESEIESRVFIDPRQLGLLELDPAFTALLALERRQMARDALILHCAYVEWEGEAILFSAPSGTGKTTQANLWERHRCAKTVNGDRSLLRRIGGRWHACGWPVCGSSGVCRNRALPIRAVVLLSQAPEDRAERLGAMKAFTGLYSQITVNRWHRADTLRAMTLTEDLIASVPVYHLACTMEPTAVSALEAAMGCTGWSILL